MALLPIVGDLVYGPVRSRRLGWSLGVNVFPPGRKICNFNCAYCQYGWTREYESAVAADRWPAPSSIAEAVRGALVQQRKAGLQIDRLTLAGSGEPTLHPQFANIVDRLSALRDEECPTARVAVLSNGGTLDRPAVLDALARVDEAYLKLDAADDALLKRLNGSRAELRVLLDGMRKLPRVTIQSLFTRDADGRLDNTTPAALQQWIEALLLIAPAAVHVYTLDRSPAWASLEKVPKEELRAIADLARAVGIDAMVF
jgi:wyosine [tRNA(Phe)-imidazoG37] synthetase (radical SAM superfamily)